MYAELHCHSWFSLLDGVSSPEALVARAAELEMPALALTDHDALYGAVAFWRAGRRGGDQAGVRGGGDGRRVFPSPHTRSLPRGEGVRSSSPPRPWGRGARGEGRTLHHLTLLAENRSGYTNLSQLISAARLRSHKGQALASMGRPGAAQRWA